MADWDGKSRPVNDAYRNNYDDIFKKKNRHLESFSDDLRNSIIKKIKKKTCPCGRSPILGCVGWHGLTEAEYQVKLSEWKEMHDN
jgi:hypothetical protein